MGSPAHSRFVLHQAVSVPRMRPADPSRYATHGGLAGDRHRRRRDRPASPLAHNMLERPGPPRPAMTAEIRSNTELPARREVFTLRASDGVDLVAEWALPVAAVPAATLATFHPLPTAGGFMDSHVIRKASLRLPALADIAVLRFNTRGTTSPHGTSEGTFDDARSERFDVDAAIAAALGLGAPPLVLLGWSFGTDLVLKYGRQPGVDAVVLLSPPLRYTSEAELAAWAGSDISMTVVVPELDDFLRPDEARERFSVVPQAKVTGVEGAKHLWVGEKYVAEALDAVASVALGRTVHLPSHWNEEESP
jgi:alpha/beta superfamily hydrolase